MSTSTNPVVRTFFGTRSDGRLLLADAGYSDDGVSYPVLARTNPVAPGGPGGEVLFTSVYLVVTHTDALTLKVTPLVDGYPAEPFTLQFVQSPVQIREDREVPVSVPYLVEGVEMARFAPRGAWFQIQVETVGAPVDFTIEAADLEYEVLRESRKAG